nr:alpha/beta hydrolase [Corynebacterium sp. TAE3-ERU12]
MLMGAGAPGKVWEVDYASTLRSSGYTTWVLDWRGTGASAAWNPGESWTSCVEDALSVLDTMGQAPVAIVGTSMGARVALHLAARRPEAISMLVLLALGDRVTPAGELYARAVRGCVETVIAPDVWAAVQALALSPATLSNPIRSRDFIDMLSISNPPRGSTAHFDMAEDASDTCAMLGKIGCPVWVIGYVDDIIAPPERVASLAARLRSAHYHQIADAGHLGYLERRAETLKVILRALGEDHPV